MKRMPAGTPYLMQQPADGRLKKPAWWLSVTECIRGMQAIAKCRNERESKNQGFGAKLG
jgi:hypothetical protein